MTERVLATITTIHKITNIEGADFIELAHYRGWQTVIKKGSFKVGEKVVSLEIDSWVPHELAPFLSHGNTPKEYNSIKGARLRTVKLRGVISQGLIIKVPEDISTLHEYHDLTEHLNIQKWEKAIPSNLAGVMKGNFPSFLIKTSQERIQNIKESDYLDYSKNHLFEVSEKLDGRSMTVYFNRGVTGVCSRNVDLKLDQEGNTFVDSYKSMDTNILLRVISKVPNFAIQGELIGSNIQGNEYDIKGTSFKVFNIFNIDTQTYLPPTEVYNLVGPDNYVPVLRSSYTLPTSKLKLLTEATGKSYINQSTREGVVVKSLDGTISFKVISNSWLLKNQ